MRIISNLQIETFCPDNDNFSFAEEFEYEQQKHSLSISQCFFQQYPFISNRSLINSFFLVKLCPEGGDIKPEQHPCEGQARKLNCKQNACPQNSTSTINTNKCPPRWQQPVDGVKERPRSMDVHKLDVNQVFTS